MKTQKANDLVDYKVNVRIKLTSLWASLMFLYIYADYFQLKTPGNIQRTMDLQTPVGEVTPGLLVIFSIILIVPSLMIMLSIFLKPMISKWVNISVATVWSLMSLLIIAGGIGDLGGWHTFYTLYNIIEVGLFSTIVWQAWNWPKADETVS